MLLSYKKYKSITIYANLTGEKGVLEVRTGGIKGTIIGEVNLDASIKNAKFKAYESKIIKVSKLEDV